MVDKAQQQRVGRRRMPSPKTEEQRRQCLKLQWQLTGSLYSHRQLDEICRDVLSELEREHGPVERDLAPLWRPWSSLRVGEA